MIEFVLGLLVGSYLVIGLFNAAYYVLSSSITSLGHFNKAKVFKHFIAWPWYHNL